MIGGLSVVEVVPVEVVVVVDGVDDVVDVEDGAVRSSLREGELALLERSVPPLLARKTSAAQRVPPFETTATPTSSASAFKMLARCSGELMSTLFRLCTDPAYATFSPIHVQQQRPDPRSGVCDSAPCRAMIEARSCAEAVRSDAADSGASPLFCRAWLSKVSRLLASPDASTSLVMNRAAAGITTVASRATTPSKAVTNVSRLVGLTAGAAPVA